MECKAHYLDKFNRPMKDAKIEILDIPMFGTRVKLTIREHNFKYNYIKDFGNV